MNDGLGRYRPWYFRWVPFELSCSWSGSGSETGSRQQDCKVSETWKDAHLFPSCHRDRGIIDPSSHWTGTRNREIHHCHHIGQQRHHLMFQKLFVALQRQSDLILGRFPARLVCLCSHLHLFIILNLRLCTSGWNNNNNNNSVTCSIIGAGRWMQHNTMWPSTFGPSRSACAISPTLCC